MNRQLARLTNLTQKVLLIVFSILFEFLSAYYGSFLKNVFISGAVCVNETCTGAGQECMVLGEAGGEICECAANHKANDHHICETLKGTNFSSILKGKYKLIDIYCRGLVGTGATGASAPSEI